MAGMTVEAVALHLIATCPNERPDSIAASLHGDDMAEVVTAALHGDVELDDHVQAVRDAGRVGVVEQFGALQPMPTPPASPSSSASPAPRCCWRRPASAP